MQALSQALAHVKGLGDKNAMLFAVDGAKVSHQCVVSKAFVEKGFKASEWARVVSEIVGGKSGGKDDSAQGAGTELSRLQDACHKASEYAARF